MNLFFRLLKTWLCSSSRESVFILDPCLTPFRCWPTDLDILRHMNNGKYFSLMDLARMDLMIRAGMSKKLLERGWYPVVAAESIRFRKSLKPFQKFHIETNVIGWDDKAFLASQRFLAKGDCIAEAVVRGRFLKKTGGPVSVDEIMNLAGVTKRSPELPAWIGSWNEKQAE